MATKIKAIPLEALINKHIGKRGTKKREAFEAELRLDLLGAAIKQARIQKNLTQTQLGELVGVQKAQISKIENSVKSARLETLLKVFEALDVKISFSIELKK
ncbi:MULTISPECIES: helix-turn-helix domain-containing protein [unclassified Paraflavitalea]|uniref:helix-turn-helix domain-containing protein n=1 Tax=unclassified Paraflavitalea TaxID=2798305 RepID=UPI003D3444C7